MKNEEYKIKNTKGTQAGNFTFYFSFLTVSLLFISGCTDSFQKPVNLPPPVSVNDLTPGAIQLIRAGLADPSPGVRVGAIEVIGTTKHVRLMPRVQRLLKDEFVPVRFAAALAVGDLEYALAERSVEQLLQDQNENVRIAAAYAMYKLGSADNLELIRQAIASDDQIIRANAALMLGKSGDKGALKLLWWTLGRNDSDDRVKFQAVEAIAMLGDERIYQQRLWPILISAYADDRVIGTRAMGALGTVEAKNALINMLDDNVLEVRLAAAEQLGMLGDTSGERVVLDVFTKNLIPPWDRTGRERAKVLAALAIGQIGTRSVTRFLPQLLKDESKFVRIAAAKAVLQCATKG